MAEEEKAETAPFQEKEVVEYCVNKDEKEDQEDHRAKIRVLIIVIAVIVLVGVAFVLGYVVRLVVHKCGGSEPPPTKTNDLLIQEAANNISSSNIRDQLRYFTKSPHVAGSEESHDQAVYMKDLWTGYGIDKVELKKYDILLSYPRKNRLPLARIVDSSGAEVFRAHQKEKIVESKEEDPRVLPPFNAYSASGNVTGSLVFVNYARVEDFKKLKDLGINVTGSIVIAKYGKIFRGNKESYARQAGAIGMILYSDPKDYSPGVSPNDTYPKTWWLPSSGVQRGTLYLRSGDPLTTGYPSVDGMYRKPIDEAGLPKIPVYPISADDAQHFLKLLTADKAPDKWQGGLPIASYYLRMPSSSQKEVNLDVQMELETQPVYVVVGTIEGSEEPDRLVLLGNHRDAWVFGATDPSSGTAALMETVRVIGRLRQDHDWRPRRTLVFLSWGGEEHGLLGSTEWVEDFTNLIKNRAVAYLNVDIAVQGNYSLRLRSSPLMYNFMFEASKRVMSPAGGSVYSEWRSRNPADKTNTSQPKADILGNSGSDFASFYHRLGVPSLDFRYNYNTKKMQISSYPVYHSVHDTFHWMANFVDRGFRYHKAISQLWVRISIQLADNLFIPFNCSRFAQTIRGHVDSLKDVEGDFFKKQNIDLEYLDIAVKNLSVAADDFHEFLSKIDEKDPVAVRMANDKLLQFERSFINPQGLPGRPFKRHVIYAPSLHNSYAGTSFPGLVDALYEAKINEDWNKVREQLSLVVYYIRSATKLLRTNSI